MPVNVYPQGTWTCPTTGIIVPKTERENLLWRANILSQCDTDQEFRAQILTACANSPILAINLFFFTYVKWDIAEDGSRAMTTRPHRPFITWPVQDEAIETIVECVKRGKNWLGWKTRDMGFSWILLATLTWFWLFTPSFDALLGSRKEEEVDATDDPDTLFWKIRYLLDPGRMPAWVIPSFTSRDRHLRNPRTQSTIDGESTNSDLGRGGRRNVVVIDEAGAVDNLADIDRTITDTTNSKGYIGTSVAGSKFNQLRFSGMFEVINMPWYRHPDKARGLEIIWDEASGQWLFTSPWLRYQEATRDPSDLAENIHQDPRAGTEAFFGPGMIQKYQEQHCQKPLHKGELLYEQGIDSATVEENLLSKRWQVFEWAAERDGEWDLWCQLTEDPDSGTMRPPQDANYVLFADIAKGSGASNSVIAVYDSGTAEQVAEFASPFIPPHELARMACAAAIWFGGQDPALVGWEVNGDGVIFGKEFMKLNWPRVYFQEVQGQRHEDRAKSYGWTSVGRNKRILLGDFRAAIERGQIIIRSKKCLDECGDYIRYDDGSLGPSKTRQEASGAREAHGDRVIANAGAAMLINKQSEFDENKTVRTPTTSVLYRKQERQRVQAERKSNIWRIPI